MWPSGQPSDVKDTNFPTVNVSKVSCKQEKICHLTDNTVIGVITRSYILDHNLSNAIGNFKYLTNRNSNEIHPTIFLYTLKTEIRDNQFSSSVDKRLDLSVVRSFYVPRAEQKRQYEKRFNSIWTQEAVWTFSKKRTASTPTEKRIAVPRSSSPSPGHWPDRVADHKNTCCSTMT
jgi:hypothetical protein